VSGSSDADERIALIVPVGGTPAAPARAIAEVRPHWIAFVTSPESTGAIEQILDLAGHGPPWRREIQTPDAQDVTLTFRTIAARLPGILAEWGVTWDRVTVDLTGGTKVMVAALALATIHHAPRYLYVGGTARDAGGTGVVVTGAELPIQRLNPWEETGAELRRRIAWAFNRLQFSAASDLARQAAARVARAERPYFEALATMIDGFATWDRFDYRRARNGLEQCRKVLAVAWSGGAADLVRSLERCLDSVRVLDDQGQPEAPSRETLADLLANALRRGEIEHKYDDAVARLYRLIEGLAQNALWERHGIRTRAMPADELPSGAEWDSVRAGAENGTCKLGLHRAYGLLAARQDSLGLRVMPLLAPGQPLANLLTRRNESLLAHGLVPVDKGVFDGLVALCLDHGGWSRVDLIVFPQLPEA